MMSSPEITLLSPRSTFPSPDAAHVRGDRTALPHLVMSASVLIADIGLKRDGREWLAMRGAKFNALGSEFASREA